jgi:transcription initiation factor IIE alpha subunit
VKGLIYSLDTTRKLANPFSSLFEGSEAAKVIDFLLSREQHQTVAEIHVGTQASVNIVNKIIENLLDIDVVGIGARRVEEDLQNKDKTKDDNTYNIRDDTDTGKAIRDLRYHLKRVLETEQFDSDPE